MEKITLANLPNQEIIKTKADQILGRLDDQTIVASTVKSVQSGTSSTSSSVNIPISPVNLSKSVFILSGVGSALSLTYKDTGNNFEKYRFSGNVIGVIGQLYQDRLNVRSSSSVSVSFSWQVIEFY